MAENPGSIDSGGWVRDRAPRELERRQSSCDRVMIEETKPCKDPLLRGEIVIHARRIGVNCIRVWSIEKKPTGVEAIARRQVVRVGIATVNERQQGRVESRRYRCASRIPIHGAWSLCSAGIRAWVERGDLCGGQARHAIWRTLQCALSVA